MSQYRNATIAADNNTSPCDFGRIFQAAGWRPARELCRSPMQDRSGKKTRTQKTASHRMKAQTQRSVCNRLTKSAGKPQGVRWPAVDQEPVVRAFFEESPRKTVCPLAIFFKSGWMSASIRPETRNRQSVSGE